VFRFNAAAAYAQLGETERAFESLDALQDLTRRVGLPS